MKTIKKISFLIIAIIYFLLANINNTFALFAGNYGSSNTVYSGGGGSSILSGFGDKINFNVFVIPIIIILIIFIIFKKIFKSKEFSIGKLIVTKYKISNDDNEQIKIEGRKGGILNFLLTHLKLDNKVKFSVLKKEKEVLTEIFDFNGFSNISIKSKNISMTEIGYSRSFNLLLFGIIIGLILLILQKVVGIIFIGIIIYLYYISKTLVLKIQTNGGAKLVLNLSSSIIEGKTIDIESAKEIEKVIKNLD